MKTFKKLLAVAVVGLAFAGTASASDPVKKKVVVVHGQVPQGGVKILPHPYPNPHTHPFPNPGPFPPKPLPLPVPVPRVDFDFVVVYKASIFSPARVYGKFETRNAAQFAALRLQSLGYPVQIVPVRDFNNGWGW